jgi:MFS family permease
MPSPPAAPVVRTADWAVHAVALSLAATVLGLSRFGYGVLLPAMRAELGWSYAEAGLLDTANAVGYLAGALLCPVLMSRAGPATTLRICAGVTTGSLLGCATTGTLPVLLVLRGSAAPPQPRCSSPAACSRPGWRAPPAAPAWCSASTTPGSAPASCSPRCSPPRS